MKRLTNEEFIRRVSFANSDVEILDEYINCKAKVHCRCKICEYMWYGFPSKNFVKYISDLFNETNDIGYIEKILNMKRTNVQYYLRKGTKLGFCNYDGRLLLKNKKGGI